MATSKVIIDKQKIDELLTRGVAEVVDGAELRKKLLSGTQLRIKLGIDPTSPHLHLGRSVPVLKMRDFQELGHQLILLVGDFTGVIGDTSDKDAERPMLSPDIIETNKQEYFKQLGTLIDIDAAETVYNSEWLSSLTYKEIAKQADIFSINQFIQRDNIRKRLDAGKRVSLREMLYPMMQGYDSVALRADVELGGTDQRFNLLAGRELQRAAGQEPQNIIMGELVEGTDGRKMSSSWGNTINFQDTPEDMYGKVMRVHDDLIIKYFTILTRVDMRVIQEVENAIAHGDNPRDSKMQLAREIVTLYHGAAQAQSAEDHFTQVFQKGAVVDDAPQVTVTQGTLLVDVLLAEKLVTSKTDFRRLVASGSIINMNSDEKISTPEYMIEHDQQLKIGKRRFIKIYIT